jgi:hypothetical protein
MEKRKTLPLAGIEPQTVQFVASRYTDDAISVSRKQWKADPSVDSLF